MHSGVLTCVSHSCTYVQSNMAGIRVSVTIYVCVSMFLFASAPDFFLGRWVWSSELPRPTSTHVLSGGVVFAYLFFLLGEKVFSFLFCVETVLVLVWALACTVGGPGHAHHECYSFVMKWTTAKRSCVNWQMPWSAIICVITHMPSWPINSQEFL